MTPQSVFRTFCIFFAAVVPLLRSCSLLRLAGRHFEDDLWLVGFVVLTGVWWVGQDVSADVRQSAFALVGDLAKVAPSHFAPSIGDLLALGIANLQPAMLHQESMSACNNACWSLGGLLFLYPRAAEGRCSSPW